MKLAADAIRYVRNQRNSKGINYARRAMVCTGM